MDEILQELYCENGARPCVDEIYRQTGIELKRHQVRARANNLGLKLNPGVADNTRARLEDEESLKERKMFADIMAMIPVTKLNTQHL